jgi:hypothetical protein
VLRARTLASRAAAATAANVRRLVLTRMSTLLVGKCQHKAAAFTNVNTEVRASG